MTGTRLEPQKELHRDMFGFWGGFPEPQQNHVKTMLKTFLNPTRHLLHDDTFHVARAGACSS